MDPSSTTQPQIHVARHSRTKDLVWQRYENVGGEKCGLFAWDIVPFEAAPTACTNSLIITDSGDAPSPSYSKNPYMQSTYEKEPRRRNHACVNGVKR